jgi:hypothetical protein
MEEMISEGQNQGREVLCMICKVMIKAVCKVTSVAIKVTS